MISLVGYTGFVGSNLAKQYKFDRQYNSKNIEDAFGTSPDICFYAGVPAEKFLANNEPEKDMRVILNAAENIKKINPKKLVLISTIDVYKTPAGVDENTEIETDGLHPYGANRYLLEKTVRENTENCLIVRLPALFGENIKKNFIYDIINVIPSMLNKTKFEELRAEHPDISSYYKPMENGFYKCAPLSDGEREVLKGFFEGTGFSAVNFTDSRAVFPFYYLKYLKEHIDIALENNLELVNFAVEPVSAGELYYELKGSVFKNETAKSVPVYDFKTVHYKLFGGSDGYIFDKQKVIRDIKSFTEGYNK